MKNLNRKKRVLLVDDEVSITRMLSMLLETRGYEVIIAHSAAELFESVSSNPDIILLDLLLPDEDGFSVCRKLKQSSATGHIPVIILSARLFSQDIVEGLYIGADDYLTKPFNYEELVARMETVMRRNSVLSGQEFHGDGAETVIEDIRSIIDEERITPFFQPIYLLNPINIFGLEALTRPKIKGLLSNPEILFKAAIQFGFYQEMETLCWRKIVEYISGKIKDRKLFLNCNPYLVEGPNFHTIKDIFRTNSLTCQNVVLEITERSAITDFKFFYKHLQRYREYGFSFAVDDVGGGYASLESIVETRPEILKIDRHIINDVDKDEIKKSIIKFIVSFSKENNILAVAEGIETKAELETVVSLGVDAGQGYYLYRPTPDVDLDKMLADVPS